MAMVNSVQLNVGDWSSDGHGKTETISFTANRTAKQVRNAYTKGSKKIGIDLVDGVCEEYEDNTLPKDIFEKLEKAGFAVNEIDEYEGKYTLYPETFAMIYMFIASLGDEKLSYKMDENYDNRINIGGYGLFY